MLLGNFINYNILKFYFIVKNKNIINSEDENCIKDQRPLKLHRKII